MTGSEMNKLTIATMQVEGLRKQLADAQAAQDEKGVGDGINLARFLSALNATLAILLTSISPASAGPNAGLAIYCAMKWFELNREAE